MFKRLAVAGMVALLAAPAQAGKPFDIHGLIVGSEGARYVKGVPTLDLQQGQGAVQLRSFGFYKNRPMFAIAFYNAGNEPVNIGPEDIHVTVNGVPLTIFSVEELQRQAKNDAGWKKFFTALGGALAASSAASERDYYHGSLSGPYGSYSLSMSGPSLAGQLRAERIEMRTERNLAAIQYQLDRTLEIFDDKVLQRTTVDPGASFGGRIVLDKLKKGDPPFDMRFDIDWNGERYSFAYILQKPGNPVPAQYASMLAVNAKPKAFAARFDPKTGEQTEVSAATAGSTPTAEPVERSLAKIASREAEKGAIRLKSGAIKVPAKTASGYCLEAPAGYRGTGSIDYPAITTGLPRCGTEKKRDSAFRPAPKDY